MTNRSAKPYGKIEIIEEMHPKQGDATKHVLVKPRAVLINGQEIYVAEDGIHIDTGYGNSTLAASPQSQSRSCPTTYTSAAYQQATSTGQTTYTPRRKTPTESQT